MEQDEFDDSLEIIHQYRTDLKTGIAYTEKGEGTQTLVFIHGLGSNRYAWVNNILALSQHYRCILVDLPNYGDSTKGDHSFSMEFFKKSLVDFCESLQLKNITIIGHSMGAQIAVKLGVEKPTLVSKLILLTPAGIETFNDFEKQWFRQINIPEILFNTSQEQIRQNFEINFVHFGKEAKWLLDQRLDFMNNKPAYYEYCKMICKCVESMLAEPSIDILHHLIQPVLVVFAEKDKLIPNKMLHHSLSYQDLMQVASRKIIAGEVYSVKNAGHFVQIDDYEQVNKLIVNFLK
jgi:pimeloyl-ACP methyl ester carboxylesterase